MKPYVPWRWLSVGSEQIPFDENQKKSHEVLSCVRIHDRLKKKGFKGNHYVMLIITVRFNISGSSCADHTTWTRLHQRVTLGTPKIPRVHSLDRTPQAKGRNSKGVEKNLRRHLEEFETNFAASVAQAIIGEEEKGSSKSFPFFDWCSLEWKRQRFSTKKKRKKLLYFSPSFFNAEHKRAKTRNTFLRQLSALFEKDFLKNFLSRARLVSFCGWKTCQLAALATKERRKSKQHEKKAKRENSLAKKGMKNLSAHSFLLVALGIDMSKRMEKEEENLETFSFHFFEEQ